MTPGRSWRSFPAHARLAGSTLRRAAPREYTLVVAASAISALSLLVLLLAGRDLLTRLASDTPPENLRALAPLLVVLAIATAAGALAVTVQTEQQWMLAYLVEQETAGGIVAAAAAVPLAELESPDFHDHLQRALRQAVHRPWSFAQSLSQLVGAAFGAAVVGAVLLTVEPLLLPALLVAGLPAAWATTRNSQALFDAVHALTPLSRERQYLQEVLTGRQEAKEIRVFESADYLRRRYDERYDREMAALRRVSRLRTRRSSWAGLVSTVVVVAVLVGLLALAVRGHVSLADAAVGAVAVQQLAVRVRGANAAVGSIQEASLFLEDYADFMRRAASAGLRTPSRPAVLDDEAGLVRLTDVWFTYPGAAQPALRGVSLTLPAGRVVALVGANGSGKTTLAKLLCHLYQPDSGSIAWREDPDGGTEARPRVSAIFQDFTHYELTGHDNVGLSDPEVREDIDRVVASAQAANADEFLSALPEGYDTVLSPSFDGGTDLSVGQWQRVALARALFRDSPLLVLDEPTAALDPSAERELIESSTRLFADRTVLVISHRFANVVDADHIYVLHEGEIAEHGTHDELIATGGRYAELFRLQATPFEGPGR